MDKYIWSRNPADDGANGRYFSAWMDQEIRSVSVFCKGCKTRIEPGDPWCLIVCTCKACEKDTVPAITIWHGNCRCWGEPKGDNAAIILKGGCFWE